MRPSRHESLLTFELCGTLFALPLSVVEGVAPAAPVTYVPGNRSRILIGLSYVLGRIMAILDIAPIFNLGRAQNIQTFLIIHFQDEYYALRVDQVGEIVSRFRETKIRAQSKNIISYTAVSDKKKFSVISMDLLLREYICS